MPDLGKLVIIHSCFHAARTAAWDGDWFVSLHGTSKSNMEHLLAAEESTASEIGKHEKHTHAISAVKQWPSVPHGTLRGGLGNMHGVPTANTANRPPSGLVHRRRGSR